MSLTLKELAARMRGIDTCLLATTTPDGLDTRPMSNNGDVEFDGTSWFFALESTGLCQQVTADPRVLVTYTGDFGFWVAASGTAVLHDDVAMMREHWDPDIERWFADGIETDGLRLVEVTAQHIRYWTFEDGDGEITL